MNADAANIENWFDQEDDRGVGASPRSSLAAMGMASLVTTQMSVLGEDIRSEDGSHIMGSIAAVDSSDPPMALERSVGSAVATRLSTGDTEVMAFEQQAWSRNQPDI